MKSRTDGLYLYDIAQCCRKIAKFVDGVSYEAFMNKEMLQDALVRNIEIIGEAAKSISPELKAENPHIAWREISRMRDKIVHHYFKLDLETVWQTVAQDVPELRRQIEELSEKRTD